jgi:hypothetical protein
LRILFGKLAKGDAMMNKTYKFVTVLMVMLLVLGLALVACKSQTPAETVTPPAETVTPPAETVTPPAAHQLTYTAKTYTNSEYGFSLQYPDAWTEYSAVVTGSVVASFSVPGFVPGVSLSVRDANEPMTADWVVAANTAEGNTNVKVTSPPTETTLFDGTPAVQYVSKFTSGQYDIVSFATSTDKNGKRIRATVWTIDAFSPYDETLFSEIARTLSVK